MGFINPTTNTTFLANLMFYELWNHLSFPVSYDGQATLRF